MIHALVLAMTLAAALAEAGTAAPPAIGLPAIPDEAIVLELRRARIAGEIGDQGTQRNVLDALVAAYPEDPTALAAALAFHRSADGEAETTRDLRGRLLGALAQPGLLVPLPLLQDVARDKAASEDELARLVSVLAAQPGTGADRIARLRLRVALLDRLGRKEDMLAALDQLVVLDPDPIVAYQLLGMYRDAGRWDDVLRATAQIVAAQPGFEASWWRLDALSALGRYDEMLGEAHALIGRWRAQSAPRGDPGSGSTPILVPSLPPPSTVEPVSPYAAARFFPMVFLLVDAGRREPAERLVADLEAANPGLDNVKRLRVMLFGSPDDRIAFLASLAGASMASSDPDTIRAEACQRLLAKDYATAHALYRRLQELDPTASSLDGTDWFNYGLAAIETGAWADAEMAMTRVLATGSSMPRAYAHRARARVMLGRATEGIADAEAALAIDPKLKQACYAMYLAYQKFGNKEKAEEWLARSKAP